MPAGRTFCIDPRNPKLSLKQPAPDGRQAIVLLQDGATCRKALHQPHRHAEITVIIIILRMVYIGMHLAYDTPMRLQLVLDTLTFKELMRGQ